MNINSCSLLLIKLLLIIITFHASASLHASDDKPDGYRSLSLRTGYSTPLATNYSMGRFNMEIIMPFDKASDMVGNLGENEDSNKVYRLTSIYFFLFLNTLNARLSQAAFMTYHEFGHGTRYRAYGLTPVYRIETLSDAQVELAVNNRLQAAGITPGYQHTPRYDDYFSYLGAVYRKNISSGQGVTSVKYRDPASGVWFNQKWNVDWDIDFVIKTGGINNSMYQTQLLEEHAYFYGGNFHFIHLYYRFKSPFSDYYDAAHYTHEQFTNLDSFSNLDSSYIINYYNEGRSYNGQTALRDYYNLPVEFAALPHLAWGAHIVTPLTPLTPTQMVQNYIADDYLNKKKYNISPTDIKNGESNAINLSVTSYMIYYSIYKYYKTGSARVKTPEVYGVKLPDLSFYLNRNGLSYRLFTGYRIKRWTFPIAYEWITKGDFQHELNFGIRYDASLWNIYAWLLTGKGSGGGLQLEFFPDSLLENYVNLNSKRVKLGLRMVYHALATLAGERNTTVARPGDTHALDAELYLSLVY